MKRYAIFSVRSDGHADLYADTDLLSEAERFEEGGYLVVTSDGLSLKPGLGNAA